VRSPCRAPPSDTPLVFDEPPSPDVLPVGFDAAMAPDPVAADESRVVDPGFVIALRDEIKTKALPSTGRKVVWTPTALVLIAGFQDVIADSSPTGLFEQLAGRLGHLDVLNGRRSVMVLADGTAWIRPRFEGLGLVPKKQYRCNRRKSQPSVTWGLLATEAPRRP
jgi:hypothetical protein